MVFSVKPTTKNGQELINCQEAYNLFDLLSARYLTIEQLDIWDNFVHDPDLKSIVRTYCQEVKSDVTVLENLLKRFSIKGFDAPRAGIRTSSNTEIIYDEFIGQRLFIMIQESIEMFLKSIRSSTTNDYVRKVFIQEVVNEIKRLDLVIRYLKLKAWIHQPPMYPNISKDTTEQLDCGEAFHLWDHLTFRYNNIKQTDLYLQVTHDGDFKLILRKGFKDVLEEQASTLEKELLYFGIPLPKRPSRVPVAVENTEFLDDDHMFRIILTGIEGAAVFHAQALKQCVTNDRIRTIFKQLLLAEIKIGNRLIIYGKTKGWLNEPPQYRL